MSKEHIPEFSYTKKDFIFDWFSGTGAGGQHRNKHQNCLRLTHIPSGITVIAQDGRERQRNIRFAFERLKPKLTEWIESQRNSLTFPKNFDTIRTYNIPDNRVVDHVTGEQFSYDQIDKEFDKMIMIRRKNVTLP